MNAFKIFVRTLKVMKNKLFIYLVAIVMMTVMSSMIEIASSILTKQILECAQNESVDGVMVNLIITTALGIVSMILASVFMAIYNNNAKWATLQ